MAEAFQSTERCLPLRTVVSVQHLPRMDHSEPLLVVDSMGAEEEAAVVAAEPQAAADHSTVAADPKAADLEALEALEIAVPGLVGLGALSLESADFELAKPGTADLEVADLGIADLEVAILGVVDLDVLVLEVQYLVPAADQAAALVAAGSLMRQLHWQALLLTRSLGP